MSVTDRLDSYMNADRQNTIQAYSVAYTKSLLKSTECKNICTVA